MDVKAHWEKHEGNQGTLTFEVDAESFTKALDQAFKKVVKQVNIPGFRKGKVPRMIFEQRFGVESLYQDAVDIVLPEAYSKAIDETGIEPVDQPDVDIDKIEKGSELIFKAEVTVKPEVQLGDYKGLTVEEQNTEVTDEEVDEQIKQLQERYAELAVKEDGEIEDGDTAVIDFEGFVDGVAFEGGKGENYSLEIGSGSFIPGFEEQLIGLKTGEEKDITVTFPEEYHAEDLKGKEAVFKVKVHEIKVKQLPELDDEFAKDVDEEVETFAELKEKTAKQLKDQREQAATATIRDEVVEKAAQNATIDIPEAMIKSEQDRMVREFEQQIQSQGMTMDMYYQFSGTDENGLREQMKENAETRVRANLTLEAIAEAENIEVSDEEVEEEIQNIADTYKIDVEQVKQMLTLQGGNEAVKGDLKVRKAVDLLVENSKAVPKSEEKEENTEEVSE
ncbi:trigger factor [Pullulanibacillus pueri]|uniref:Trigger factor n=1 Tax=Pullulanibacillus pueri TaxID=1437324 RepID=A0A8J2ZWD0_9BACL|nr:trigger factor [Pullulanibacillus pueri]MBM7681915.1 trigger factor [Pullulanibacillus pueri]GGH83428.1 trigger factor [Pullulanibacillus pueri]